MKTIKELTYKLEKQLELKHRIELRMEINKTTDSEADFFYNQMQLSILKSEIDDTKHRLNLSLNERGL